MKPKLLKALKVLSRATAGFGRADGGNIALWGAAAVLPIAMFVGAATDFRRVESARSLVQDAADAAVLAAAKTYLAQGKVGQGERRKAAEAAAGAALQANLGGHESMVGDLQWNLQIKDGGNEFTLLSRASSPAAFGGLFGLHELPVRVSSSASTGMKRVEVALVLDNTGSMEGVKIDTLRRAGQDLVDRLISVSSTRADPSAMRIALVPFSMTVNVGARYASAAWMDQDARSPVHDDLFTDSDANRFALFQKLKTSWGGCVEARPDTYDVRGIDPSSGSPGSLFVPYFAPDEPGDGATAAYPNDYLADSDPAQSLAQRQGEVAKYEAGSVRAGSNAWGYQYGPNAGCQLTPVVRLTSDATVLRSALASMRAVGDTNIPMGLSWGWNALSPSGPFGDGVDYKKRDTIKIAILMTDGQNNVTPVANHNGAFYSGVGYMWQERLGAGVGVSADRDMRRAALDDRLAELCSNMKKRGVVIYTIRVEVTEGSDAVLKTCATHENGYFNVENVSGLPAVFDVIADSITGLRISH